MNIKYTTCTVYLIFEIEITIIIIQYIVRKLVQIIIINIMWNIILPCNATNNVSLQFIITY